MILRTSALCLLLTGCALSPQISQHATSYNRALERMTNEVALLNVVRSQKRMPRHYTTISSITGQITITAGAEFSPTFPGSSTTTTQTGASVADLATTMVATATGANTFAPEISGSIESNPNFTVAVLDTQEFSNGILQPLSANTIGLYRQQGWQADMLLHLMIESVEFVLTEKITAESETDSKTESKRKELARFRLNVTPSYGDNDCRKKFFDSIREDFQIKYSRPENSRDNLFSVTATNDLVRSIAPMIEQNLLVSESINKDNKMQYTISRPRLQIINLDFAFKFLEENPAIEDRIANITKLSKIIGENKNCTDIKDFLNPIISELNDMKNPPPDSGSNRKIKERGFRVRTTVGNEGRLPSENEDDTHFDIDIIASPRSTDGIFYFVGEYLRRKNACIQEHGLDEVCFIKVGRGHDLFFLWEPEIRTAIAHYSQKINNIDDIKYNNKKEIIMGNKYCGIDTGGSNWAETNFFDHTYAIPQDITITLFLKSNENKKEEMDDRIKQGEKPLAVKKCPNPDFGTINQITGHRSMQVMTLLQQLVNLNKASDSLPRPTFIDVD